MRRLDHDRAAAAVEHEERRALAGRHGQRLELNGAPRLLLLRQAGHLQRRGDRLVFVDRHALRFGLERERQRGVHDQSRLQRARRRAIVRHTDEDQVVARRAARAGSMLMRARASAFSLPASSAVAVGLLRRRQRPTGR